MTSSRETLLCQYHYDPLDRLIGHALPDVPERQRFYSKSRLATEIQGAMRYSIVQHGDQLLAQQRSESGAPDSTLLATDQQRSVLQVLNADHPRQPIAYSLYGHRPVESGLLSLLGFNGERPDPVTGGYLLGNGYRTFNPVLMRFNSPDSLSPFGEGGLNFYTYCLGDPINRTDETGHFSTIIIKSLLTWASRAKDRISTSFARSFQGSGAIPLPFPPNPAAQLSAGQTWRTSTALLSRDILPTTTMNPQSLQDISKQAVLRYTRKEVKNLALPPPIIRELSQSKMKIIEAVSLYPNTDVTNDLNANIQDIRNSLRTTEPHSNSGLRPF